MLTVDEAVLRDPHRLAAVERMRSVMSAVPVLLDTVAATAARSLAAPLAVVSLVGDGREHLVGVYDPSGALDGPAAYPIGRSVLGARHHVASADVLSGPDPGPWRHPPGRPGVRALLGVPLSDGDNRPVGGLTVLDLSTRQWSRADTSVLCELAGLLCADVLASVAPPAGGVDQGALLDSVQEAFLAVDPDGVVVGWNRAARDLLGYAAAEVCGRHLDDSVRPDHDGRPIGAALNRLFAGSPGRRTTRTVTVRHRDGHRLTTRALLSVLPATAGPLACVFLTDMSGQVAAEQTVDLSDRFLAALLDSLSVGVIACDDRGRVVLVNRALRETQGLAASAPAPDNYGEMAEFALRRPDMTPMSWSETPLMRAVNGEFVHDDVLIQAPGERLRTFATTARPIIGGDGGRLGAVAVAHEVTAVRRAEQFRQCHLAVARALAAASSAAQAAPGVLRAVATTLRWPLAELWLIDETPEVLRSVGHWSAAGLDTGAIVGRTVTKGAGFAGRVWATGRPLWIPDIAAVGDAGTAESPAVVAEAVRLGIRTVLAVPVRDGDTMLGVLVGYADAPEHHEDLLTVLLDGVAAQIGVFVALRRAVELSHQLDRAKDDFIALVGHEMRTPLTSITANATMLGEDADAFEGDHRQMLRAIQRNSAALQGIVDSLLDLAGLDAGYLALTSRPVDLAGLVTEAVDAARPAASANGLTIDADLPGRLTVSGDARRLRQVLDNLLSNAVRYSPDGGDVRVRLRAADGLAELDIADGGIGIPRRSGARSSIASTAAATSGTRARPAAVSG